jgi:hypothetical protein
MMNRPAKVALIRILSALVGVVPLLHTPALAQESAQPAIPPASEPTLDELLGLTRPGEKPQDAKVRAETERGLRPEDDNDGFARAVDLMETSARRLVEDRDPGLDTQRMQAEALAHLDKMIDEAQRQRNQRSRQRSSQQQQSQQNQQQGRQSSQSEQQSPGTQGGQPNVPRQDGAIRPPRVSDAASWGNLPEHVRQALTQGMSDRFSSLYQQMTEQYYRRLAEQAGQARRVR